MLINTFLDTEDFVHLYYPEDEPAAAQGCGAGARMASKYPPRPPSPEYTQTTAAASSNEMSERERSRAPPPPEPPPHRVRAADLYPRLRTHYDEPALEVPFTPICAEFVQWVGKTADGGTVAMSNYRLHSQPRRQNGQGSSVPIRLIDAVEIRDLLHLVVSCKNGRQLKFSFNTSEQCVEWLRRLNTALLPMGSIQETFAAAYAAWAKEQPHTSVHRALLRASHAPQRHWFGPEVERLGFTANGAWRVTAANADYKLCASYPPLLVVPAAICDEDLDSVARFRAMRRIPAVVWRHRGNGAVIARSSQPEVGWLGWRSSEDERLLAAFVTACNADRGLQPPNTNKQLKLLIVDARSYASAVTNRARGGGCECQQYYPAADIQFMYLPNIHHVRKSFQQMRALAADPADQANWHSNLERTLWLQYVSGVLRAASVVARAVLAGRPALVHCSDGWDRTPQIVAAAQLILDPYYRTIEGFRVLIEREWLDFGHKFADRCGHQFGPEDPNERSPIFLQWLDVVHQIMVQYPCSFEFNDAYLIKLGTHVHSCMFGTFLCNTTRERLDNRTAECTAQVWHLLRAPAYRNHLYSPHHLDQEVWPECSPRSMQVWAGVFGAEREAQDQPPPRRQQPTHTTNGLMTKTRSCDNLLNDGEKRMTQRRCSDPSIAPDVMKLSLVVNDCRAALTDSCVDALPFTTRTQTQDQVDGLHPDHFESGGRPARDLASGSSSLERELADVSPPIPSATGDRVIDHGADAVIEHSLIDTSIEARNSASAMPSPAGDTPDEPPVFLCDTYTVVVGMEDASKGGGRIRNDSITWRSVSESSNQSSSGLQSPQSRAENPEAHNDINNHESTERGDAIYDRGAGAVGISTNSAGHLPNGVGDVSAKFMEVDLNGSRAARTWSSASSESDCDGAEFRCGGVTVTERGAARARVPSQLTLCPASPRRMPCCHCTRQHGSDAASESCWCGAGSRCVCGAGADAEPEQPDGLPPALDPMQARLHQIILYQKKVVEELSGQLREAREALRLSSPPLTRAAPPPASAPAASPTPSPTQQKSRSGSGSGSSSSGSLSEVEVGEEARGVVWVPDSAAPRCQHCRNHFWLARRRHHCRRCGGIFCGSCSEMSAWGECGSVRVCRRCRAQR